MEGLAPCKDGSFRPDPLTSMTTTGEVLDEMSNLYRGPSMFMLPTKFRIIWQSGFREDF
jgi:hypothetical protein